MGFPIFISSGGRTKRVLWNGRTFEDLAKLYFQVFSIDNEELTGESKVRRGHFYLKHAEFGVLYEGFELSELTPGSLVEVRGPHALKYGANSWEVDPDVTGSVLSLESDEDCETDDEEIDEDGLLDMEGDSAGFGDGNAYDDEPRTVRQKIWKTLDDPSYSRLAKATTVFIMATIVLSTAVFIIETLPRFHGNTMNKSSPFYVIEATCIAIFTLELLLRLVTAPPHLISFRPFRMAFFKDLMNVIDILAILPFYIETGLEGTSVPGLAILRVVRLVRVFRLFKVSKGALVIFLVTMKKSAKPLYMLIFFTALAVIIFSSLMHYAERGVYDSDMSVWRRLVEYQCSMTLTVINPALAHVEHQDSKIQEGLVASDSYYDRGERWLQQLMENELAGAACETIGESRTSMELTCTLQYIYAHARDSWVEYEGEIIFYSTEKSNCEPVYEVSPFQSIPATMWWCLVTMTTVGYGDMYPILWYGRALGMLVMLSGILVIALPITVIGSNFADVYRHMVGVGEESAVSHEEEEIQEFKRQSAAGLPSAPGLPESGERQGNATRASQELSPTGS